ncbi:diaminopimelate epimerase [Robbsia sp. Bb-Pol-6]|uniref:Diaminopimelate epimerase n=1 Tax=Robbsia betulipollinis TaxID=2981849 RepID=A0ABT3ZK62_9BURK|nr:diaminopimelate epimerase [Robbsia betulipollinis]MCY0386918.1 diaminopimelate epimerase [Robbsia betulipollinis]
MHFTKMQGAGNDFVVLDATRTPITPSAEQIRRLADRHFGIGADQVLLVEPADDASADFRYRIFNQDGGEVEHCGNGARCFARYVVDQGLTQKRQIRVQVQKGLITLTLQDNGEVTVDMGAPELRPAEIPFDGTGLDGVTRGADLLWPLAVNGRTVLMSVVSMGNPHAVQVVDDVAAFPVATDGPVIESHPRFPARVNAGFMEVVDRHTIRLRVHERGAGETLACGTGACAAAVAGIRRGLLDSPVAVHTHGGVLTIGWEGLQDAAAPVTMTGPATTVFRGEITL